MEKQKVILLIAYFLFFVALSGRVTVEIFIIGILISATMVYLNTGKKNRHRVKWSFSFKRLMTYILFGFLLVKEIVIANINVALILIKPKIIIEPCIVKYKTKLKHNYNRVILANTITLTPGTLTVDLSEDELTVHCLSQSFAAGIYSSKLERLLIELEE